MKKESISPLPIFPGSLLVAGLLALLLVSCASTQSASLKSRDHSRPPVRQQPIALQSQEAKDPDTVETRLTELFDLCRSDKPEEAALYFVYRGPDKKRERHSARKRPR
jgi:hypothetical protein